MQGQLAMFESWIYEEDTGTLMAKCPKCSKRMSIHMYQYGNPYSYCPYCGKQLEQGGVLQAGAHVYGWKGGVCFEKNHVSPKQRALQRNDG